MPENQFPHGNRCRNATVGDIKWASIKRVGTYGFPYLPSHCKDDWRECTLCRSNHQSKQVLQKAKQRQVNWPKPKLLHEPMQDPEEFTSIDDAFATVLKCMSSTSKHCKRYYLSNMAHCCETSDKLHCARYHTKHYTQVQRKNPLECAEDVHIQLVPGNYSVTAGDWETGQQQQTHMVHIQPGQTLSMDFCVNK